VARRFSVDLAAILWHYLAQHESCLAAAADASEFGLVTTVPSGRPDRDERHPLRRIVGELVGPTRGRHERLLRRSDEQLQIRSFSWHRYEALRPLSGQAVLLIDDTWTTGANAQSAAAALKAAGAGPVGAVVIGRHVNRDWHDTDRRLRVLARPFRWDQCALCVAAARPSDERPHAA
jgi:predicted phosphoribosyltransferase